MKLIESKAELILQQEGLEGVYKQIEFCGRTCYKSENLIQEGSAKAFVERMINSKHTAMLEQGTVYLKIPYNVFHRLTHPGLCRKYFKNPYTKVSKIYAVCPELPVLGGVISDMYLPYLAVTTNYRVMVENGWLDDLQYICEPTEYHEKRYTFKFTTDRGVSHELVRHRVFSFAQESTRYCNYSKDKFDGEITYITPSWLQETELPNGFGCSTDDWGSVIHEYYHYPTDKGRSECGIEGDLVKNFVFSLQTSEQLYLSQLKLGWTPQQARQVLPNALKTEVCMTGFASDWKFFFDLRYYGETGKPHPDMESLASKARAAMIQAGVLWYDIMAYPSKL